MSFQANRLRVQLPCGDATVIEEAARRAGAVGGFCRLPSQICFFPSWCGCFTCGPGTFTADWTILGCPAGTLRQLDPGPLVVDPEHLPVLREALEAQLKEIEKAEKALEEHGGQGGG